MRKLLRTAAAAFAFIALPAHAAPIVNGGFESGVFAACKLYPAHATTNSEFGVTDVRNIRPALEAFYASLDSEQKAKFNRLSRVAER